jgi:hypothetical protein
MASFVPLSSIEIAAAILFAVAVVHTFSTKYFEHLAHVNKAHAGLWHLLGEVEAVFGFWAVVLLAFMAVQLSPADAIAYLDERDYTEPAFVFVVMVIAASRPILVFAEAVLRFVARSLPLDPTVSFYFVLLSAGPLLGSFITEPAAMTLVALLLRDRYFARDAPARFKYATLGVLFVNISIGSVLTPYAAPPVLMVAGAWGWDFAFMMNAFGWKAAIAVVVNAAVATCLLRGALRRLPADGVDRRSTAFRRRSSPFTSRSSPASSSPPIIRWCSLPRSCFSSASPRPIPATKVR